MTPLARSCVCMLICDLCVCIVYICAGMRVPRHLCVLLRHACLPCNLCTFCSKYIFSSFTPPPLFILLPHSFHFRVLLDRTTLATGSSPLSTLHPKACGFWKLARVCVCDCCECADTSVSLCTFTARCTEARGVS